MANQFCQYLNPRASLATPQTSDATPFFTNLVYNNGFFVSYYCYYYLNKNNKINLRLDLNLQIQVYFIILHGLMELLLMEQVHTSKHIYL
jgi:hypothetical protein